ncbi:MAG: hypothetical protein GY757_36075 [bacterium]|nr:hypothetical protein [bacterium]
MLGNVVLIIGLIGPLLDFTENEISWALLMAFHGGETISPGSLILWNIIRNLSYLPPLAAAALAAMALWSKKPLDRVMTVIGTVFTLLAVPGLYVSTLYPLTFLWYLLWFSCAALLLWRRAAEINPGEMFANVS